MDIDHFTTGCYDWKRLPEKGLHSRRLHIINTLSKTMSNERFYWELFEQHFANPNGFIQAQNLLKAMFWFLKMG